MATLWAFHAISTGERVAKRRILLGRALLAMARKAEASNDSGGPGSASRLFVVSIRRSFASDVVAMVKCRRIVLAMRMKRPRAHEA